MHLGTGKKATAWSQDHVGRDWAAKLHWQPFLALAYIHTSRADPCKKVIKERGNLGVAGIKCPKGEEWVQECASEGLGLVSTSPNILPNLVRIPTWSQLSRPSPALLTRKWEGFTTGGSSSQARPSLLCLLLWWFAEGQHVHIGLEYSSKEVSVACSCSHFRACYSRLKPAVSYANHQLISISFSGNHILPGHKDTLVMSSGTVSSPWV